MLKATWGESRGTRFIVAIRKGVVKHLPVTDLDAAPLAIKQLDEAGWDVYYAPAQFAGNTRKADQAVVVPGLWMDLDCGEGKQYPDPQSALQALTKWLGDLCLPRPTHLVQSGYGLHVYWLFDAPVPLAEWREVADRFKRSAVVARICDDPGVIADAARILRVPGTHNHKHEKPVPVRLLFERDERVRVEDILERLPALGPRRALAASADDEWSVSTPLPPGDAEAIAEKCAQLRHVRDTRGKVSEPLWRAALSVLWRCDNAEHWIHEWSKGDERYDPDETRRKAEATAGPATCEHFSELDPERCKGCPHAGKVRSPILLSVAPDPVVENHNESWRRNRTRSFTVTSGGVWYQPEGEDQPARITQVPIWLVEVRERAKRQTGESDDSSILLEWVGVDGRRKRAVCPQADVYSFERFKTWAARENLAAAVLNWKGLVMYISQVTLEALKEEGARRYHETLGWYEDGFVVGNKIIRADGEHPASIQSSNPISQVRAAEGGSLQGWAQAVAILNEPRFLLHQLAIQAGFGSPLLELCGLQSAVVALVGPSGTGKTMAADLALSIYGHPRFLRQGAQSSHVAIERQLGSNRNVPYLIDEITQWTPAQAGKICYVAANGQGDAKLKRSRENYRVDTWRLVPFVTSNRPLTDYAQTAFTGPQRARLLELFVGRLMEREVGAELAAAIEQHHGHACRPYLQWLCANRSQARSLVDGALQTLTADCAVPDSHRFALWTLAVAAVGGAVAHGLGIIPWEPMASVRAALKELESTATQVKDADEMAVDLVSEWLTEHNENISFWPMGERLKALSVRDPIARVLGEGVLAIHRSRVNNLLAENGVSRRAATKLFSAPNLLDERRIALAPGTAPVWCYFVRQEAVGFSP